MRTNVRRFIIGACIGVSWLDSFAASPAAPAMVPSADAQNVSAPGEGEPGRKATSLPGAVRDDALDKIRDGSTLELSAPPLFPHGGALKLKLPDCVDKDDSSANCNEK